MANHPPHDDEADTASARPPAEATHPSRRPTNADEPGPALPAADPPGDTDGKRYEPL